MRLPPCMLTSSCISARRLHPPCNAPQRLSIRRHTMAGVQGNRILIRKLWQGLACSRALR